jgi:hypothetical protein
MTTPVSPLDHAVVNVLDRMDEAVERYRRLGFHMTERGHHTLGSINHLAVFDSNYLELIGFEKGATQVRTDILRFPIGLNALVLATDDPIALHDSLSKSGVPAEPPIAFSRPVEMDGIAHQAKFRTVRLAPDALASGRVYFCQHLTRELVWRREWQTHPNGVTGITRAVVAAREPRRAAAIFLAMFGADAVMKTASRYVLDLGNTRIEIVPPAALADIYGDAAPDPGGRAEYMALLTLKTTSLDAVAQALADGGIKFHRPQPDRLVVPAAEAMNTMLEFVER